MIAPKRLVPVVFGFSRRRQQCALASRQWQPARQLQHRCCARAALTDSRANASWLTTDDRYEFLQFSVWLETLSACKRWTSMAAFKQFVLGGILMNSKVIILSATFAFMTGSAFAGSSTTSALDDPAKMSPFFTDAGMKTMKSEAEAKAAWSAMSQEDKDAVMKDCADADIAKAHENFCKAAMTMGK
ncbi:hypothetical protein [Mesorhizobium sp. M0676]